MKTALSPYLYLLLPLLWTGGIPGKENRETTRTRSTLTEEKTARAALPTLNPEDISITTNGRSTINKDQDPGGSSKTGVNLLDQLPAVLQEEQHLTDSALDYSSKLSPSDQRLMKQFDADTVGKHDESSSGITSTTEGVQVDHGTLRNGRLDKDFYSQISQIEGDQPPPSYIGKISAMYDNNPMPEYSYKEPNYGSFSDYSSDSGGQDKYYINNPFSMSKSPLERPKSKLQQDDLDRELFQALSKNQQPSSSNNGDIFSTIGKEVFLNYLKHQNDSQKQSLENLKEDFLKKLTAGNSIPKDTGTENALVNKWKTTTSPGPFHFPTLPSKGNQLASGKIFSSEELPTAIRQTTELFHLPKGISLGIKGNVFQEEQSASSRMITDEQAPSVRQQPSSVTELQNNLGSIGRNFDKTTLNDRLHPEVEDSVNENLVTLKISGAGKPVSFKAGTSIDGSLVLKIPGNVTLVDSNMNKDVLDEAASSHKANENSKTEMANIDPMNSYLRPAQEFTKKENMIKGHSDNQNKETMGWQILGKTRGKFNQDTAEHNFASETFKDNHVVMSSSRPTQGSALNGLFILPTAVNELSELAPTKYHDLSHATFSGVGKSPPSEFFPPVLKMRQNEENNKLFSLKSFLVPSKLLNVSPVNRASLSVGPDHILSKSPANGRVSQESQENYWSPCSVTCGQGVQARARLCEGEQCKGYRTESKACFMQTCPEQLGRAGLRLHNKFRAWHDSPPLKWSNILAAKAKKIAQKMAGNSIPLADLEATNSGINVAALHRDYDIAAEKATAQWYSEIKSYNFVNPKIRDSNKHFTQLIWRGSKRIGIGEAKSADGRHTFVVAVYDPPGNIKKTERANVRLPKSRN
ncbi:uncharacterized protein [Montipora foliosa]|uniref:uncharacterized protein isoform X2 n=1 Tax=Montipora foliosa TaxID=591990 RepID=UPI0035F16CD2